MSQYNESAVKTFIAKDPIGKNLRVKWSAAGDIVEVAGDTDKEIGVTERPAFEANEQVPVRLRTAQGTFVGVAAGAIGEGDEVYAAASGKVDATGTVSLGIALDAATAANDLIEILRVV